MDSDQEYLFQKVLFDCLASHPFLSLFLIEKGCGSMISLPGFTRLVPPIQFTHTYPEGTLNNILFEAVSKLVYEASYHALHLLVEGVLIYQSPLTNSLVNVHTHSIEVIPTNDLDATLKTLGDCLCFYSRDLYNTLPHQTPGHYLLGFLEPKDVLVFAPSKGEFDGKLYLPYPGPCVNFMEPESLLEPRDLNLSKVYPTPGLDISAYYLPYALKTSAFKLVRLSDPTPPPSNPDFDPLFCNSLIW